ncbi:hypothetical protein IWQ60_000359 [Tieghemiomyces parasiticus]|uniref:Uncharacterized protein n=1 Tax=Tieghemiomyces parasiticus TaxID=78921 RepID=A0A9W8ALS9_9FUNG|nr:hypothetical protein IWQ60_000359 [Tieghemiomyces parasiticus]
MGQPTYGPAGEVLAAGEDLSTSGLTSFMFDILYVTWFVHLGSLVSRYFWYFYLVIPGYCGVKIWGYLWPVVAGFLGRGSPGMAGPEKSPASTQAQNGRARSARA